MVCRLLNNRCTFSELKNDENNICWRIRFSAIAHIQKAPITASLENVPDTKSFACRRKYYHLFKQNVLSTHIRKYTHYWVQFLVNIWNEGKNLKICVVKTTANMLDLCNIWPFIMIFMDLNYHIFFLISKIII